jgi:hypothetical protein
MIMNRCLRAFAILTAAVAMTAVSFEASPGTETGIPDGARAAAESYADQWCQRAQRDPHFYGVVGKQIDCDTVVLGEGYITYYVQEPDAIRFAESSETNPTQFATALEYEFPLFFENELIATLHIGPNRDRDGELVVSGAGDYRPTGFRSPGRLDSTVVSLMRSGESSGGLGFAVVRFVGCAGGTLIRKARAEGGAEMIPFTPSAMSILGVDRPLEIDEREAAAEIKRRILGKEK